MSHRWYTQMIAGQVPARFQKKQNQVPWSQRFSEMKRLTAKKLSDRHWSNMDKEVLEIESLRCTQTTILLYSILYVLDVQVFSEHMRSSSVERWSIAPKHISVSIWKIWIVKALGTWPSLHSKSRFAFLGLAWFFTTCFEAGNWFMKHRFRNIINDTLWHISIRSMYKTVSQSSHTNHSCKRPTWCHSHFRVGANIKRSCRQNSRLHLQKLAKVQLFWLRTIFVHTTATQKLFGSFLDHPKVG